MGFHSKTIQKKTANIAAILEKLNSVVLGQTNQNKVQRNTDGTGRTKKWKGKCGGQLKERVEFSDLLGFACCARFDLVVGGGCGSDLHDWGRGFRARNRSAGLWWYGGRLHLPNQPHAAFDADVGVSFPSHVKNLQAVVIETRHLALEGTAVVSFPAPDLDGHLAVEDCELTACGRTKLLQYKKT